MFQCELLVTDIDWISSIVVRASKEYSTSVMSQKDPIANDLIEIIDDNPFVSPSLLEVEVSIWTNAILMQSYDSF